MIAFALSIVLAGGAVVLYDQDGNATLCTDNGAGVLFGCRPMNQGRNERRELARWCSANCDLVVSGKAGMSREEITRMQLCVKVCR